MALPVCNIFPLSAFKITSPFVDSNNAESIILPPEVFVTDNWSFVVFKVPRFIVLICVELLVILIPFWAVIPDKTISPRLVTLVVPPLVTELIFIVFASALLITTLPAVDMIFPPNWFIPPSVFSETVPLWATISPAVWVNPSCASAVTPVAPIIAEANVICLPDDNVISEAFEVIVLLIVKLSAASNFM